MSDIIDSALAGESNNSNGSQSQADKLVELAEGQYRFGQTTEGQAFAVKRSGPNIALMLRGSRGALRSQLAREYRLKHRKTASSTALADAMVAIEGAASEAEAEQVYLRVAHLGENIIIDIGDQTGRAIVVDATGWKVADQSPVLFRRTALTAPLPIPERGGTIDDLHAILNVSTETWPLLLAWMVAAYFPDIGHPILMLGGLQGTGKTTTARYCLSLIDPTATSTFSQPRDVDGWAVAASGAWGVLVDNISNIPSWWSDALCKAVTGDGVVRRALYSDSDLSVLSFRRVIALTSIDAGAMRGDLGSRALLVDLEPIESTSRRTESDLNRYYSEHRAGIFGALLDIVAAVIGHLPSTNPKHLTRMADFCRILAALDTHYGLGQNEGEDGFLARYREQENRIAADVVEADPVAEAVKLLAESIGVWEGSATELLLRITPNQPPKGWPTAPNVLSGRLKRTIPALRAIGIDITMERGEHSRNITVTRSNKGKKSSSSPSASSFPDDHDDHDGLLQTSVVQGGSHERG